MTLGLTELRVVVDTNALVSRMLLARSTPARAVNRVLDHGRLLVSSATLAELARVLARDKFDRWVSREARVTFLEKLAGVVEVVHVTRQVRACRDLKDDALLEVAVNGQAHCLVTGDKDLLVLHPYLRIPILTPAQFVAIDVDALVKLTKS